MTQHTQHANSMMQQCIQHCQTCHTTCLQLVPHCLQKGGQHAEASHIGLLLDCADICQTSANFMLRNSALHAATCRACAVVCARCATDCARFSDDDEMQKCAQICRHCAETCQQMAEMA